ncbi:hypothetical protein [Streptomyces sp. NPDC055105]|uniref:hypothetical protein n=1 Tax=Streptomyces sp. NPDC055105 TaxID=3365719 RepID=UPI0037D6ADC9
MARRAVGGVLSPSTTSGGDGARHACPTPAAPPEAAHNSQTVIDNPATRQGGGINSGQHSEITLTDSKISDNLPDNTAEDTPARGQNT